jgi:hypothetical protein
MELGKADCPMCSGKGHNDLDGVGRVMCFTCRGKGFFLLPKIDTTAKILPRKVYEPRSQQR